MMKFLSLLGVITLGCGGGGGGQSIDGPTIDIDAAPDALASGVVTVQFANIGTSVAGLAVSFADPSGTPTTLTMTDANGMASATVVSGSSVTIAFQTSMFTVLALQPGDALVIAGTSDTPTTLGTANVSLPGVFAGAASCVVSAACAQVSGAALTGNMLQLTSDCLSTAGTYDLVAYAHDSMGKPIAYTGAANLTPPPAGQTTPTTLGSWRTDFDTMTVAAVNAPTGSAMLHASLSPEHAPVVFPPTTASNTVAAGGSVGLALLSPNGGWDSYYYNVALGNTGNTSTSVLVADVSTLSGVVPLDLTTGLLPFVHDVAASITAGHTSPTMQFVADGSIASALGFLATYAYTDAGTASINAIVIGPSTIATSFDLPSLPDALASFRPGTTFTPGNVTFLVADGTLWSDSRDFRENWVRIEHPLVTPGKSARYSQGN